MKIFSWMKSKLHGKDNTIKPEPQSLSHEVDQDQDQPRKEEFSGCPSTLLAIGTFGNNLQKDSNKASIEESGEDVENTSMAEYDKELRLLLNNHTCVDSEESERFDLSIDKLLESSPEDDEEEITNELRSNASQAKDALLQTSAVHRRGQDIPSCGNRKKAGMYTKSVSFLLRKALLCGGGFTPFSILRDPFPDTKLDKSRMDKILRAVLRKKKFPPRQKYLDTRRTGNDEEKEDASNGNNWVQTDSEYILLEL